jgi:hypothetical protein
MEPDALQWFNKKLRFKMLPIIAANFEMQTGDLWLKEASLIKFSAHGDGPAFRSTTMHRDSCLISFNILLNSPSDFTGGQSAHPIV